MTNDSNNIVIIRPDDFHVHFRDFSDQLSGACLQNVAPYTAAVFGRALVMPNTLPPILTAEDANRYKQQILEATSQFHFEPLMTIKLLKSTTAAIVREAKEAGVVACKFYPEGATTHANDLESCRSPLEVPWALEAMEEQGMVLCLHGEVPSVFCLQRETLFLECLTKLSTAYPKLKIVLEHITTREAVECVLSLPENVAATITAHHLELTLDDIVGGSLDPHAFCKPIAKTPRDRDALVEAALSGSPKFFFGSDTAPHLKEDKCHKGCAGIFSAPCAMEVVTSVFDSYRRLHRLENFTSRFGALFYELPISSGTITLTRSQWTVPGEVDGIQPYYAKEKLYWKVSQVT